MKKILYTFIILALSYTLNAQEVGLNIGNIAPEIRLPNTNGDTISLSSLRGKLVLIDFWASWCGPCRKENPQVVKTYNKYKNKHFTVGENFTIYGVSLDQNSKSWEKGIQDDGLEWINVSELKAWKSEVVQVYKIRSIPDNFLINGDGIIIGKNLRGEKLNKVIEAYVLADHLSEFEEDLNNLIIKYNLLEKDKRYTDKEKYLKKIKKSLIQISHQTKALKNN